MAVWKLGLATALVVVGSAAPTFAAVSDDEAAGCLRSLNPSAASLLDKARTTSPLLSELIAGTEASNLRVYVSLSTEPGLWRGRTQMAGGAAQLRTVFVTINAALAPVERLAILGHELQHVRELAAHPEIRDGADMRRLFQAIGHAVAPGSDTFETAAAQAVEFRVRGEAAGR